jgi:hypothetical protein
MIQPASDHPDPDQFGPGRSGFDPRSAAADAPDVDLAQAIRQKHQQAVKDHAAMSPAARARLRAATAPHSLQADWSQASAADTAAAQYAAYRRIRAGIGDETLAAAGLPPAQDLSFEVYRAAIEAEGAATSPVAPDALADPLVGVAPSFAPAQQPARRSRFLQVDPDERLVVARARPRRHLPAILGGSIAFSIVLFASAFLPSRPAPISETGAMATIRTGPQSLPVIAAPGLVKRDATPGGALNPAPRTQTALPEGDLAGEIVTHPLAVQSISPVANALEKVDLAVSPMTDEAMPRPPLDDMPSLDLVESALPRITAAQAIAPSEPDLSAPAAKVTPAARKKKQPVTSVSGARAKPAVAREAPRILPATTPPATRIGIAPASLPATTKPASQGPSQVGGHNQPYAPGTAQPLLVPSDEDPIGEFITSAGVTEPNDVVPSGQSTPNSANGSVEPRGGNDRSGMADESNSAAGNTEGGTPGGGDAAGGDTGGDAGGGDAGGGDAGGGDAGGGDAGGGDAGGGDAGSGDAGGGV